MDLFLTYVPLISATIVSGLFIMGTAKFFHSKEEFAKAK